MTKKTTVITLLNDGKNEKKEGQCNSWPNHTFYLTYADPDFCDK
jgi:hypothetical protein